jgi:hypothetical protein
MDHSVAGVESESVRAAEAMPEGKYSFAPTNGEFKGVRTFATQAKHVTAVNYLVGGPSSKKDHRSNWVARTVRIQ